MDEVLVGILVLVLVVGVLLAGLVLPIVALTISIRSKKKLTEQINRLEAALAARSIPIPVSVAPLAKPIIPPMAEHPIIPTPPPLPKVPEALQGLPVTPQLPPGTEVPPGTGQAPRAMPAERIESVIGRRWLGWAAVTVILFAAAFFLKYAFDNRWIGELGRVAIGVAAGVTLTVVGFRYHQRRWRIFSQILSAGGVVLLYLSTYAAFGYYHLATQKPAFAYLAILVAETAGLALLYNAPAIAIMALVGGFLTPILLHSERDQYRSLFGYLAALDLGALVLLKQWPGLSSLAFAGTHLLFWLWYDGNYHPQKLGAVMVFQTAVFLIFLFAHLGRRLARGLKPTVEGLGLLLINPFVFFATSYHLLNPNYHDWMGVFAIGLALIYAGAAKILLDRAATTRSESLLLVGTALTFVTIAIPIQLQSNWITIGWAVEALVILWAGLETKSQRLRVMSQVLFALALVRLVFWDTPFDTRPMFTPVVNKYFLSSLAVTACLFGAAFLYRTVDQRKEISAPQLWLVILMVGVVTLWFVMSVEDVTFFAARAAAQKVSADAAHERWLGQMGLSVLWSVYAAALAAMGFVRRLSAARWAALALFALTTGKAMLVDIAQLQQLYRIIVFFVLGLLLLVVSWGYQKAFHSWESSK